MAGEIKVVTFNLRVSWETDGINSFLHRMGIIYEKVKAEMPDIIGFQEVQERQLECLERLMPEYVWVGQGRNANVDGEGLYLAVRKESMYILMFDTFWMSPEPYKPGSRFEIQSEYPRICNVARVYHKATGKMLYVYNLHLDHMSKDAQEKGIRCVLEYLSRETKKTGIPSILMGDFNAKPDSRTIDICHAYTEVSIVDVTTEVSHTLHKFGTTKAKIDYLFVTKELEGNVLDVGIWEDRKNGIYLSDHYPVYLNMKLS